MKRLLSLFLIIYISAASHGAINKSVLASIVSITTSDINGNSLGKSLGFAISAERDGFIEVIAPYSAFKKATKAVATNNKGKQFAAHRITGANDLYDVVRFSVADNSIPALPLASEKLSAGQKATILTGITNKKQLFKEALISDCTEHGGLTYYTISMPADSNLVGSPLLNDKGQVVAVVQRNANNETSKTYAIGIEFNTALAISTMSAANPSLNNIYIPKQLPGDEKQASSYLYLLAKNSEDSLSYLAGLEDFIAAYPTSTFGYLQRADYYIATNQFGKAEADYDQGLAACDNKADIHNSLSEALYHLNQKASYTTYKDWTLQRALDEVDKAYGLYATPLYLMQRGKCLYAMKRYQEAYDTYSEINKTNFRSSENLFYQSRALEMAGGDSAQVLALLDSAIVRFVRPLREDAAPYILYHAQKCDAYGKYREAVVGYQDYQELVGLKNLNDRFYYFKEQAEIKCHFYPQALADIERAIAINPNEYVYYIEKALIETRTGQYEDAIISAKQAQRLDDKDPDSYKLIGISQSELGNKAEARKNLQKALDLGDAEAGDWLKSMK